MRTVSPYLFCRVGICRPLFSTTIRPRPRDLIAVKKRANTDGGKGKQTILAAKGGKGNEQFLVGISKKQQELIPCEPGGRRKSF